MRHNQDMRYLLASLVLALLLAPVSAVAQAPPPMLVLPERAADFADEVECIPAVVRFLYHTPTSRATPYYELAFFVLATDHRRPFLVARLDPPTLRTFFWIDLDRDGQAEEYYSSFEEYRLAYPDAALYPKDVCDLAARTK